eukprot:sb/3462721/
MSRWVDQLGSYQSWVPLSDELDKLATSAICKIAFDMDVPFSYRGESDVYKFIDICFGGIKDVLFNPLGMLKYRQVEKVRGAAKALREIGENFIRDTYDKMNTGSPLPDAMFSYVLQEIKEAGTETTSNLMKFLLMEVARHPHVYKRWVLVAGGRLPRTETTSNLMKFLLMEVARHPHVYKRLQAEIDEVMCDTTAETYHSDLNRMRYLDQVIAEALRMYPVAVATTRTNPKETYLGKTLIPANSCIMVCWYTLHRNPEYFSQPEVFDPDRWAPDKPGPLPFTYLPFSSGPRSCAGKHIAKLEAKIITSMLLYHYDLTPHPDMRYEVSATIAAKPSHPLMFKVTSRNQQSRTPIYRDPRGKPICPVNRGARYIGPPRPSPNRVSNRCILSRVLPLIRRFETNRYSDHHCQVNALTTLLEKDMRIGSGQCSDRIIIPQLLLLNKLAAIRSQEMNKTLFVILHDFLRNCYTWSSDIIVTSRFNPRSIHFKQDFVELVENHRKNHGFMAEELREAFAVFDIDGDGEIDTTELVDILTQVGDPLSQSEAEQLVRESDLDGDGKINYVEFVAMTSLLRSVQLILKLSHNNLSRLECEGSRHPKHRIPQQLARPRSHGFIRVCHFPDNPSDIRVLSHQHLGFQVSMDDILRMKWDPDLPGCWGKGFCPVNRGVRYIGVKYR